MRTRPDVCPILLIASCLWTLAGCAGENAKSTPPTEATAVFDCDSLTLNVAEDARPDSLNAFVDRFRVAAEIQGTEAATQDLLYSREVLDWDRVEWIVGRELCGNPALLESPASATPLIRMRLSALDYGGPAPQFSLPILDDRFLSGRPAEVDLKDLRGKYVVVAFWATWCGPCKLEYPVLVGLDEKYGGNGLEVITVLFRDTPESALQWLKTREHPTLRTLVDPEGRVARAYRVGGIPETVLIDPLGRVSRPIYGWRPERREEIDAFFGRLVAGLH